MPNQKLRIIINGASGKMGQETIKAIENCHDFSLVAKLGGNDNLSNEIKNHQADIVIDFTTPHCVYENVLSILEANAHPVIGTSGLSQEQIENLQKIAKQKKLGGIIAPNFSIGAVLMMQLSKEAAKYFPHVEIIEFHHDKKKDAPSGTATKTAELIAENRKEIPKDPTEKEILAGARGGKKNDIHIHSVRLPGFIAHQEVIFGGLSETLTIRHDSIHRESFMPGVILACKKVMELNELVYGLEKIMF